VNGPSSETDGKSFWLGVMLIAASFAIYPAYPVIALLPLPVTARVGGAILGSMLSWGVFFVGSMLAGRRGVHYVKRYFSRMLRSESDQDGRE
jgi:hypothetical protein